MALIFNRLDAVARGRPPAEGVTRAELTRSPSEYLRNVYVDTANQNRASQLANVELMGPERMLFGTDPRSPHRWRRQSTWSGSYPCRRRHRRRSSKATRRLFALDGARAL